jgi:hypothetical protein
LFESVVLFANTSVGIKLLRTGSRSVPAANCVDDVIVPSSVAGGVLAAATHTMSGFV